MALSLFELQMIRRGKLDIFYERNQGYWDELSAKAYVFAELNFIAEDEDYVIHAEDAAAFLMPVLEVNLGLSHYLGVTKLREKYWVKYFCDYLLDRYMEKIQKGTLKQPASIFPSHVLPP